MEKSTNKSRFHTLLTASTKLLSKALKTKAVLRSGGSSAKRNNPHTSANASAKQSGASRRSRA